MKNIYLLSTSNPSKIQLQKVTKELLLYKDLLKEDAYTKPVDMFITSDEEIKEGEYYIHGNRLHRHLGKKCLDVLTNKEYPQSRFINKDSVFKKIILTTDQDLIKDGVQSINDEFLEWFVKNPSCESVEVEQEILKLVHNPNYVNHTAEGDGIYLTPKSENLQYGETLIKDNIIDYKIIIPKEEPKQENCCTPVGQIKRYLNCVGCDRKPKQETFEDNKQARLVKELANELKSKQETLEEVAERLYPNGCDGTNRSAEIYRRIFIDGVKWQAEQDKEIEKKKAIEFAKYCLDKAKDLDIRTAFMNIEEYYEKNKINRINT